MWTKDTYAFCIHFYDYAQAHPDETIPMLYQEGAILLATAEESPLDMSGFKFDPMVSDKYNRFVAAYNQLAERKLDNREMGRRMKAQFGSTYWWYYFFYTDFTLY